MKTSTIISILLLAATPLSTLAQANKHVGAHENKASFGISGGHYRYDPGIAVEFTTRGVFQNHLSLRLKGGKQWLEDYKAIHNQWVSYQTISAGLVYNGQLFDRTRFYAELGIIGIVPNPKFSESGFVDGLYELSGVEITLVEKDDYSICLFLGVGPAFTKAFAEKIEGRPRYGHGLHFVNGLRIHVGK